MIYVEAHQPQSEDEGSHSTEEQEGTDADISTLNYEKASLSVGRKTTFDTNHSRKTARSVSPVAPVSRPVTADSSAASDDIARASWTTTSFAEMPNTLDELTNQNHPHHHHHHQETKEARKTVGGNITSGPGTDIHALVMKHRGSASILTKYIRPNVSDEGTQAGIPSRDWLNSLEQLLIHFFLMVFESSSESNKLVMEMISSEAGQQIEEIFQLLLKAEPEMYKEMGNLVTLAEKWLVHWKGNQEEKNKAVQYVKLYMQGVKDKNYYNLPVQVRLHKLGGFIAGLKVVGKPFHLPAVPPPEKARACKDNGSTSRLGSPRLKPAAHFSQVCANILCGRPCDDPLPKAELYADKLAANLFKNPLHGDEEIKDYTDLKYGQYFQKKELFSGPRPRCVRNSSIVDETGDADSQQESQQGPVDCSLNYHCWIPKYTKSYIENLQNRNCGKNGVFRQDGRESYNDPQSKGGYTGTQDKACYAKPHMGCGGNNDYMGPNGRGGYYGPHGAGGYPDPCGRGGYPDPYGRGGHPDPCSRGGYPGPHDKGGYPCPPDKGGYPGPHDKGGYPCPHDKGGYPGAHGKGGYSARNGKGGYSGRDCKDGVLAHGLGGHNRSKKQKKLYEWVRGPDGKVHRRVVGSYTELGTSSSYHSGDFDRRDARHRKFGKKGKGLRGRPPKAHSDTQLSSNGFNERKGNNRGGAGHNKSTKNKATEAKMAENATSGKYTDKSKDLKQNTVGYQMDGRTDDGSGDSRENDIEGPGGRKDMFRNMYGKADGRDGAGGRRGERGDGKGGRRGERGGGPGGRWGERGGGPGGRWGERGGGPDGRRGERGGGKSWRGKGAWNTEHEWEGEADDFTDFEGERNARYEQDKLHMLTLNDCWEKAGKIFKKPSKALVIPPPENLMLHLEKKYPKSRWPNGKIVRQRLYPNGASFVEEYSNRSSKVFYPHGGLAVAVSGPSPITSQVLVVRDPSDQMFFFDKALIADLNSSGKGTIYAEDGTVKAQYSSLGGFKLEDGDKARKWQWNQGGQRNQVKLNKYMSLRMSDHNRIFLNFNGNQRGFSVNVANGLRVKVMSSNTGNQHLDPIMRELKNLVRPKTAEDNFDLIRGEFRHPPRMGFIDRAKHYKHLLQEENMLDVKENGDLAPTDYALDSQFQNSGNAVRTSSSIIFRCSSGVKSCGQIRGSLSRSSVGRGFGCGSRSCSTTRFGGCDYGSNGYVIYSNEVPTYCPSATCRPPYY